LIPYQDPLGVPTRKLTFIKFVRNSLSYEKCVFGKYVFGKCPVSLPENLRIVEMRVDIHLGRK